MLFPVARPCPEARKTQPRAARETTKGRAVRRRVLADYPLETGGKTHYNTTWNFSEGCGNRFRLLGKDENGKGTDKD